MNSRVKQHWWRGVCVCLGTALLRWWNCPVKLMKKWKMKNEKKVTWTYSRRKKLGKMAWIDRHVNQAIKDKSLRNILSHDYYIINESHSISFNPKLNLRKVKKRKLKNLTKFVWNTPMKCFSSTAVVFDTSIDSYSLPSQTRNLEYINVFKHN